MFRSLLSRSPCFARSLALSLVWHTVDFSLVAPVCVALFSQRLIAIPDEAAICPRDMHHRFLTKGSRWEFNGRWGPPTPS